MEICIVDAVGNHSGTHYYNSVFRNSLLKVFEKVTILTNYDDPDNNCKKILDNFFTGNTFIKICKLVKSVLSFHYYAIRNRSNVFIIISYGEIYDFLFISAFLFRRKKLIIDIHEFDSLVSRGKLYASVRTFLCSLAYKQVICNAITHSRRTNELLDNIGYTGKRVYFPHFSYDFEKSVDLKELAPEVIKMVIKGKTNILFFGHIRKSKGIDILTEVIRKSAGSEQKDKMNFIVAGNDTDRIFSHEYESASFSGEYPVSALLRYITDKELNYLFSQSDFIFLPYREISQSGVLEMAIYFRKPVIASPIPYFENFLFEFKSFGVVCKGDTPDDYLKIINDLISGKDKAANNYFTQADLEKFKSFKKSDTFQADIMSLLEP